MLEDRGTLNFNFLLKFFSFYEISVFNFHLNLLNSSKI